MIDFLLKKVKDKNIYLTYPDLDGYSKNKAQNWALLKTSSLNRLRINKSRNTITISFQCQ
jgi:hypothetical protein